ncbi:hypothetical protein [Acidovorax sp. NCPPB 3576]|uniref:hypothetical protein n=1 Tax=Acidovorax sp. NCPPB 3576 TaxID=2940488 RepID=UPI00234B4DDA|nr:hypothetical protein [Acidovorax sp. NCPPB 3576]WCM89837.1 hypothetical protein M5C98_07365 [Acidovorax sp. NCPPB 3576]
MLRNHHFFRSNGLGDENSLAFLDGWELFPQCFFLEWNAAASVCMPGILVHRMLCSAKAHAGSCIVISVCIDGNSFLDYSISIFDDIIGNRATLAG